MVHTVLQNRKEKAGSSIAAISEKYSAENEDSAVQSQISVEQHNLTKTATLADLRIRNFSAIQIGEGRLAKNLFESGIQEGSAAYQKQGKIKKTEEDFSAVGDRFFERSDEEGSGN